MGNSLQPADGVLLVIDLADPGCAEHVQAIIRQLAEKSKPGPEVVLFNEIGNDNSNVKSLFEASYHNLKKMIETRIAALNKLKRLPLEESREEIADKARVILASLVGAVVVAKSISQEDERRKILQATQKQILALIGAKEDTLRTNTAL